MQYEDEMNVVSMSPLPTTIAAFVAATGERMTVHEETEWPTTDFVAAAAVAGLDEAIRRFPEQARTLTYVYRHFWPVEVQEQLEPLAAELRGLINPA
jgi:hypothetical protein